MERNFSIRLAGVPANNSRYSDRLSCVYCYTISDASYEFKGKQDYEDFFENSDIAIKHPIVLNYRASASSIYDVTQPYLGLFFSASNITNSLGSFYRREYDIYERKVWDGTKTVTEKSTLIGQWEPVMVRTSSSYFRDFNIKAGHSYQYVMYPTESSVRQAFALNRVKKDDYTVSTIDNSVTAAGDAIHTNWPEWSITELLPVQNKLDAPIIKKIYQADVSNIWFFKYNLEVGSQKQNITKTQVTTLGQYPRIAHGQLNHLSGDVSCMLGSEIVPYSQYGYVERMRKSISLPLSTNEKIYMLNKWRALVYSKNPKLLKDNKGQSWIVSITSGSNSPMMNSHIYPDKINFTWVEIESTKNVIIYGEGEHVNRGGTPGSIWESTTSKSLEKYYKGTNGCEIKKD